MQQHNFGGLFRVSTLTLGGGGLGMLWGPTSCEECVATVHAAVEAGINLIDLAPRYGDGKAEEVVGEALPGGCPRACGSPANAISATRRPPKSSRAAAIDRGEPETVAPIAARSVLSAFERRAGRGPHRAPSRRGRRG